MLKQAKYPRGRKNLKYNKCLCVWHSKWSPLINRISRKIGGADKKTLAEFANWAASIEFDRDIYKDKADCVWPNMHKAEVYESSGTIVLKIGNQIFFLDYKSDEKESIDWMIDMLKNALRNANASVK